MTQRLKLPDIDPGVTIELGSGTDAVEFKMKPVTLDVEEALDEVHREIDRVAENPDSGPLDRMEVQLKQLDVLFDPLPRPGGDVDTGRPKTPSEALLPGYKDKKVTARQINNLIGRMMEAARPT